MANWAGGGAYGGMLYNCTVTGNTATNAGGGVWGGTLSNCIVYFNSSTSGSNWAGLPLFSYCCTAPDPLSGPGNITDDPLLVDPAGGMFRLKCGSPCIDAGTDLSAIITNDLAGNLRPLDGNGDGIAQFDIGAYDLIRRWIESRPSVLCSLLPISRRITLSICGGDWRLHGLFLVGFRGWSDRHQPISASHAWASPGQYTVRLSAHYSTLGQSLSATTQVQVVPQPVYYVTQQSKSRIPLHQLDDGSILNSAGDSRRNNAGTADPRNQRSL